MTRYPSPHILLESLVVMASEEPELDVWNRMCGTGLDDLGFNALPCHDLCTPTRTDETSPKIPKHPTPAPYSHPTQVVARARLGVKLP